MADEREQTEIGAADEAADVEAHQYGSGQTGVGQTEIGAADEDDDVEAHMNAIGQTEIGQTEIG